MEGEGGREGGRREREREWKGVVRDSEDIRHFLLGSFLSDTFKRLLLHL